MKNKHWKKEGFQIENKMWFNVYVITLFFWKYCIIQLNISLPSITTSFFSPIGLRGYVKANLGSMLLCTICDNQFFLKNYILWKLSSIQMKILNDIACNLNSNTLNGIEI
jgi:hypothetical protein